MRKKELHPPYAESMSIGLSSSSALVARYSSR
jgi:hypothetical protein